MAIRLEDEQTTESVTAIKRYFAEERDEEIGDLGASLLLEFLLKEIGPSIYNRAIRDAQETLQRTVGDLDLTLYEPEFGYTTGRRTERNAKPS